MKTLKSTIIILIISLFTIACSKDDDNSEVPPTPTVHTVGFTIGSSSFQSNYWKNNILVSTLFDPTANTNVNQILINNGNVYTTGDRQVSGNSVACYAKNGVTTDLTNGSFLAKSNCIYVDNNIVYTAGYERNSSGKTVAKYWVNGVATPITNGVYDASVLSIYVSGSDIYCAGYEDNSAGVSIAKIWRNTTLLHTLGNGVKFSSCESITVKEGVLYSCGYQINSSDKFVAIMWKGNVALNITSGSQNAVARSITTNNNKVYTSFDETTGTSTSSTAKYYTYDIGLDSGNTTLLPSPLSTSKVIASSIFIHNNDVYVAGNVDDGSFDTYNGIYWKNGIPFRLNTPRTSFRSIFVTN
jgi:hypothetical protein